MQANLRDHPVYHSMDIVWSAEIAAGDKRRNIHMSKVCTTNNTTCRISRCDSCRFGKTYGDTNWKILTHLLNNFLHIPDSPLKSEIHVTDQLKFLDCADLFWRICWLRHINSAPRMELLKRCMPAVLQKSLLLPSDTSHTIRHKLP